jgi:uncharacterized DUF497 family protein
VQSADVATRRSKFLDPLTELRITRMLPNNDAFEWDDAKAESNYHKHGVDFETATDAFADHFAIERADPLSRHNSVFSLRARQAGSLSQWHIRRAAKRSD